MQTYAVTLLRMSVWAMLMAATLVASFWLMLVFVSGFDIWATESNAAGLTLQAALIVFPVALFFGLKLSAGSFRRTVALFVTAWATALGALMLFGLLEVNA